MANKVENDVVDAQVWEQLHDHVHYHVFDQLESNVQYEVLQAGKPSMRMSLLWDRVWEQFYKSVDHQIQQELTS